MIEKACLCFLCGFATLRFIDMGMVVFASLHPPCKPAPGSRSYQWNRVIGYPEDGLSYMERG